MTTVSPHHALSRLKVKLVKLSGEKIAAYPLGYANLLPESSSFLDVSGKAWENICHIVSTDGSTGFLPNQVIALTKPQPHVMHLALLLDDKTSQTGYAVRFIDQDFESAAEDLTMMDVELVDEPGSVIALDKHAEAFDLKWLDQEQSVPRIMQRTFDSTSDYGFKSLQELAVCFAPYGFDISDVGMLAQAPFSPDQHSLLFISVADQKHPETFIIYAPFDAVMQELLGRDIEMVELPAELEPSTNSGYRLAASRHFLGERLLKALRPDIGLQAPRFPDNIF